MTSFKKISKGKFTGWLREELLDQLPPTFFSDPVSATKGMGGMVIKESRVRWAAIVLLPNGKKMFFKKDRTQGWADSLKYYFFPSNGRKEWFMAYQLRKRNIPVPRPYGWMEKVERGFVTESYYLSEAIGAGTSLMDDPVRHGETPPAAELARTLRKIHEAGFFHRDLHAGNFLWDGDSLVLTDLHRARILRSLSFRQRLWNLSQILHSLRDAWKKEEQKYFLERYLEEGPFDLRKTDEVFDQILSGMKSLQRRQWKSRTKRCLKESTEFSVVKQTGTLVYHRRDYPLDRLNKVIEQHLSFPQEAPALLVKQSPEVIVSFVKDGEGTVCVKQFRHPRFWDHLREHFRTSRGLRAWVSGNGLRARGVSSLKPVALVEKRRCWVWRESFLVMEVPKKGQEMDRYMLEGFRSLQEKRRFVKTFGRWLSHLHHMDLYHRDMKTCNILVGERGETWEFILLDLEDVFLDEKVDERKLFKNFLQLNTSTPRFMTKTDRLRFFKEYHAKHPIIKNDKMFLTRLIQKSKERGIVYVSSQGVVQEEHP